MFDQNLLFDPNWHTYLRRALLEAKAKRDIGEIQELEQLLKECTDAKQGLIIRNLAQITNDPTDEPKHITYRGFQKYEIDIKTGKLSAIEPKKQPKPRPLREISEAMIALRSLNPPNLVEDNRKETYPSICTSECTHRTCPYYTLDNFEKPCQMQWEHLKHKPEPMGKLPTEPETILRNLRLSVKR